MTIIHNPTTPLHLSQNLAIAIGTFDGVHLGHQAVVERVKTYAKDNRCSTMVITYDNHPSQILRPNQPTALICTNDHRISLLQSLNIDYILLFTFDHTFAQQTAEEFLHYVKSLCAFNYLNMGYDGHIGRNRSGDEAHLKALAKRLQFTLEYLPPFSIKDEKISSTNIRKYIMNGELEKASQMLGRPYSIVGHVVIGRQLGRTIGFPTANLLVHNIITPPPGVWSIDVLWEGHKRKAVANLGFAPTINSERELLLEVHIPRFEGDLYGKQLEIIFKKFIRSEKKFDSLESLQTQLKEDVGYLDL